MVTKASGSVILVLSSLCVFTENEMESSRDTSARSDTVSIRSGISLARSKDTSDRACSVRCHRIVSIFFPRNRETILALTPCSTLSGHPEAGCVVESAAVRLLA